MFNRQKQTIKIPNSKFDDKIIRFDHGLIESRPPNTRSMDKEKNKQKIFPHNMLFKTTEPFNELLGT